jgi:hypothetical protein
MQTHSRTQTGPCPATGRDEFSGTVLPCRRGDTFTTAELQAAAAEALGITPEQCPLGALRYELWKLRAKGLVEKLPHSRRYRLLPNGHRTCLLFLKLFDKIYAPLTAGLLHPCPGDRTTTPDRLHQLDKLYQSVAAALDELVAAVGLKLAARFNPNENTILVGAPITVYPPCSEKPNWALRKGKMATSCSSPNSEDYL